MQSFVIQGGRSLIIWSAALKAGVQNPFGMFEMYYDRLGEKTADHTLLPWPSSLHRDEILQG